MSNEVKTKETEYGMIDGRTWDGPGLFKVKDNKSILMINVQNKVILLHVFDSEKPFENEFLTMAVPIDELNVVLNGMRPRAEEND